MGTVYAATHRQTGESVAVKVLSRLAGSDDNMRQRFALEIETLKKLRHRNIVQLTGHGEEDGTLFFVMERVHGESLHQQLKQDGPFQWTDVVRITLETCQALKHAHDRGVIHRDLKPANLMLAEDGTVKLTDFGIAKFFGSQQLTGDHAVIGTIDYMAPEQADGQQPSVRTDLYSLGSVIYALLTGRPPFASQVVTQVLHRLKYDAPLPLIQIRPEIPAEFDQIVMQLLEKDPAQRIPTALALQHRLQAMQHALNREPAVPAEPESAAEPASNDSSPGSGSGSLANRPTQDGPYTDAKKDAGKTLEVSHAADGTTAATMVAGGEMQVPMSAPENHYTEFESNQHADTLTTERDRISWLQHLLRSLPLLLALLALGYGAWHFTRPPAADELIQRIDEAEQNGSRSSITRALRDIDIFLQHYADHPQVRALKIQQQRLQRELSDEEEK